MLGSDTLRTVESRVLLAHEYAHLGLDSGRFDAMDEPEASCTLTPWPPLALGRHCIHPRAKTILVFHVPVIDTVGANFSQFMINQGGMQPIGRLLAASPR